MPDTAAPTYQELVLALQKFWGDRGCVLQQPYDVEVGAGTMCSETFLRVLGPKPYRVAYVQPSRRPADGRYGENPHRLYKHQQLQVILKPSPDDVLEAKRLAARKATLPQRESEVQFPGLLGESPLMEETRRRIAGDRLGEIEIDLLPLAGVEIDHLLGQRWASQPQHGPAGEVLHFGAFEHVIVARRLFDMAAALPRDRLQHPRSLFLGDARKADIHHDDP